ncbi:MAG: MraY family glycosyltransferase [Deinococcales bacterium]
MKAQLLSLFPMLAISFMAAFVIVIVFVSKVRDFAKRVGAVQQGGSVHGQGQRMHQGAIPNIGGIAIFGGFILAMLLGSLFLPLLVSDISALNEVRIKLLAIILGATLMCLIGFIDDIWEVPASLRLGAQLVAAGILVINDIKITFITNYFGQGDYLFFSSEFLAVTITLLWVVGFTNAFNFIDGLDGLSSGIAAISSLALLAVALNFNNPATLTAMLLLAALAGSALGFLRHNFNPASIIMGDSGAYLLGYTLAAVSILGALKVTAAVTVAVPVLILGLPLLNITQVTLRRLRRGSSVALASNDHLHDILRLRSGSKRLAVLILWSITLVLGALGMFLSQTPPMLMWLTLFATVTLIALVSYWRLREVAREARQAALIK